MVQTFLIGKSSLGRKFDGAGERPGSALRGRIDVQEIRMSCSCVGLEHIEVR